MPTLLNNLRKKFGVKNETVRALLGEFVGTFILVFIIVTTVASAVVKVDGKPALNAQININFGVALGVAFGVAAAQRLSGGHINPAISALFLTTKQLSPVRFVIYVIAQLFGAFFGAALAYLFYRDLIIAYNPTGEVGTPLDTAGIFASYPTKGISHISGLLDQVITTALFGFIVAHVTDPRNKYPAWFVPVALGGSFLLIGSALSYNTGYPTNPARDLAPRIFSFFLYGSEVFRDGWWVYPVVGPLIGGPLGGWIYHLTLGFHTPDEDDIDKYRLVTVDELKELTHEVKE